MHTKPEPLTEAEETIAVSLLGGPPQDFVWSLIRSQFNGEDVAVVAAVRPSDDGDGMVDVRPVAILVNDTIFDGLLDPDGLLAAANTITA
jgi:hypothetical protein